MLLSFIMLLAGCDIVRDWGYTEGIPDLGIETPGQAARWVAMNIEYEPDGVWNNWQTPKRTYADKTGDCEDFTALWMYLVETQTEYTGTYMIIGEWIKDSKGKHAYGYLDGLYYEPITGWWGDDYSWAYTEYDRYDYDKVMLLCLARRLNYQKMQVE